MGHRKTQQPSYKVSCISLDQLLKTPVTQENLNPTMLSSLKLIYLFEVSSIFSTSLPPSNTFSISQKLYQKGFRKRTMRLLLVFLMVHAIFIPCFTFDIPGKELPLTLDYYKSTCPTVFDVIKKEMECIVKEDPRNAAIIIRLHFHDCFAQVSTHLTPCLNRKISPRLFFFLIQWTLKLAYWYGWFT